MANLNAVLTRPKVSENYARNAFDRGFSPKLHYQLGQLTPFFAEPFIAGSHVKLNRSIFQRTARVNTAAFPKVDTHCEFFFVPMRQIWSYWNNYKLNIQDFTSSYNGITSSNNIFTPYQILIPQFNLYNVKSNIRGVIDAVTDALTPYFSTIPDAVDAMRLLDLLGYGDTPSSQPVYTPSTEESAVYFVNAFKLAAYQKVYYDHFRNTAYESNDPTYYNLDAWSTASSPLPPGEVAKLLTLRYVNYRKDYFQSIYPALNYVATAPNGTQWNVPSSVIQSVIRSTYPSEVNAELSSSNPYGLAQVIAPYAAKNASFSVQNIRAAFALDKLLRASSYAPKHVKDQFEARYGVKGVESGSESVRIGAYMNDIVFQEVTATSSNQTTNTKLGDIGGKGVGFNGYGKDIEFTCKEDGIILGLIYSLPRTSYDSRGLKNWNGKIYRDDFFIPEYMNLGMQPMYASELRLDTSPGYNADIVNNTIIGYHPRYSEYKIGIDENHGLFNRGGALSDFVVHSNNSLNIVSGFGANSNYFKVKPTDMDSIFVESSDPSDMTTDKFVTYLDIKCVCNQNMSVHGQPSAIG